MIRGRLGIEVFDAALDRLVEQYSAGHRMIASISGGKDSTCCLELAVMAASMTGRLPVEAVVRDEEILYPGTYEYLDRVAQRDDVDLHHLVANQPIVNAFNREDPYWWVFDPLLDPDEWVRQPPAYAEYITDLDIRKMVSKERFPVEGDQRLVSIIGLRCSESKGRTYGLFATGGYMTRHPTATDGAYGCRPVYDWSDADVWRAIQINGWDYSSAYNVMHRRGIPRKDMRIGPPSMNAASIGNLRMASQAWPEWWDRVCRRLPGMRTAAAYGKRVVEPERRWGETWQATYQRECIDHAPGWIAERAIACRERMLSAHARHATTPFPEVDRCQTCTGSLGSWKALTRVMYYGDPFSMKATILPYVDPSVFRPGSGSWAKGAKLA